MLAVFKTIHFKIIVIIIIQFYCLNNYSQSVSQQDSLFIEQLYKNAKDSIYESPNKSIKIVNQIIQISNKKKYQLGIVKANFLLGLSYYNLAKYNDAIIYYQKSIDIARKIKDNVGLSKSLNNLSSVYVILSDYEKALTFCHEALLIRVKQKDTIGVAKCYQQLTDCYFRKNDLKRALFYIDKTIYLTEKLNLLSNYTDALRLKGLILIEEKKYKQALLNLEKSLTIADSLGDKMRVLIVNSDIATTYYQLKDFENAKKTYLNLLQMEEVNYDLPTHLVILNNLGSLYLESGKPNESEKPLLKGLLLAKEVNNFVYLKLSYGNLSKLYFAKSDYKKAYYYKDLFMIYSDSVMTKEKIRAVEELTVKFETKEITEQNKLLLFENKLDKAEVAQKKLLLIIIILVASFALLFALFYFKRNKEKNKIKNNELKQKLLLSQMNPHFIFNSVDNIQSLIHQNQNKEAISYLTKFSKLTRQILENSNENYITLTEEVSMLQNYLSIQQLLYNNKFKHTVIVDEDIESEVILIPPMLTQPFIENAIKHGLKHKDDGGEINVCFYMDNLKLFFEVTDNGKGIEAKDEDNNHKSLATKIVTERLNNKSLKKANVIHIENRIENNNVIGAITYFEIPYICET